MKCFRLVTRQELLYSRPPISINCVLLKGGPRCDKGRLSSCSEQKSKSEGRSHCRGDSIPERNCNKSHGEIRKHVCHTSSSNYYPFNNFSSNIVTQINLITYFLHFSIFRYTSIDLVTHIIVHKLSKRKDKVVKDQHHRISIHQATEEAETAWQQEQAPEPDDHMDPKVVDEYINTNDLVP